MRFLSTFLAASLLMAAILPATAADSTKSYKDRHGFSLRIPSTASVETDTQENGQLDMIPDAAVVVSLNPNEFKGTNLGNASVSVGVSIDPTIVAACSADKLAQGEKPAGSEMLGGVKFTRFTFEDAGAGNRYNSTVYRTTSGGNCYEVVEFLHWAPIENFSPGSVKEFDRAKIEAELHAIARSFALSGRAL